MSEDRVRRAAALYDEANALRERGRAEDALAAYDAVLGLEPDFAEARNNRGWMLQQQGRIAEAIEDFRRAAALSPGYAIVHANLASALADAGRFEEAALAYRDAIEREQAPYLQAAFAYCVRVANPAKLDPGLRLMMARALSEAWGRPNELSLAAAGLLHLDADPATLAGDSLLRALLENAPVTDVGTERALTALRRTLLDSAATGSPEEGAPMLALRCALARQCLLNEYVFEADAAELQQAQAVRTRVDEALTAGHAVPPGWIAAVASYFPLLSLSAHEAFSKRQWPAPVAALLVQHIAEPLEERRLRDAMPKLTAIGAGVSSAVRRQYEEHPYPRWLRSPPLGRAPLELLLQHGFQSGPLPPRAPGSAVDMLIAGCGTGREALELARQVEGARALAIDLSLASLGYAARKARELRAGNIEFAQADILALGSLGRTFDVVSAVGVLHHLEDPLAGLRSLASLLRPRGSMIVALYSERGRQGVVAARERIAERGFKPDAEGIRAARADLLALPEGHPARTVVAFRDFFSMSECRDLLFHVQEHRFTLPQVGTLIAGAGLTLAGFAVDPRVRAEFAARYPGEAAGANLGNWDEFEAAFPATFAGMYVFLARKP